MLNAAHDRGTGHSLLEIQLEKVEWMQGRGLGGGMPHAKQPTGSKKPSELTMPPGLLRGFVC